MLEASHPVGHVGHVGPVALGAQARLALHLDGGGLPAIRAATASLGSGGSRSRSAGSRAGGDMPEDDPIGPFPHTEQSPHGPG